MSQVWVDVGILLILLVVGGLFTATEMSLVSLRVGQLNAVASRGRRGLRVARLAAMPTRYLAAVQIGSITAGFFAAAFGAAALADPLARLVVRWGVLKYPAAESLAVIVVTLLITCVALVISELTPRRYAMQHAEAVALLLGPPLDRLATLFRPLIWWLSKSTNLVLRVLRADPTASREQISSDELRQLVMSHEGLSDEQRRIVRDVFGASGRHVRQAMLPRTEVDFLDAALPVSEAAGLAWEHAHSRYPVIAGSSDEVIGFVHVRDLLDPAHAGREVSVRDIVRSVTAFPATKPMLAALSELQRTATHLALVVDEYGGLAGIVTVEDLVEELVGDIYDEYDVAASQAVPAEQGLGELDGLLSLGDFYQRTGISLPRGPYDTAGGLVLHLLGRMPEVGDTVEVAEHRLSVVAVQGWRIHRLRVTPVEPPQSPSG
ncbi:MAG: hemolysin family protein [Candidatus Dormibacteraeota bacterium]|nr:hemolysin family protein [Candidatus Dormibacteraeota bacterium]